MGYHGLSCFKCGKRIGAVVKVGTDERMDTLAEYRQRATYACDDCCYRYGYDVYSIVDAEARWAAHQADIRIGQERIIADAQARQDEFEALPFSRFIRWITRSKPEPISERLRREWGLDA